MQSNCSITSLVVIAPSIFCPDNSYKYSKGFNPSTSCNPIAVFQYLCCFFELCLDFISFHLHLSNNNFLTPQKIHCLILLNAVFFHKPNYFLVNYQLIKLNQQHLKLFQLFDRYLKNSYIIFD